MLLLIIGVLGFVNRINNSLREDTEDSIKSMTKIGADCIEESVGQDRLCLREISGTVALLPEEKRLGKMQEYVQEGIFSRMALVDADGVGYFSDGVPITPETDMEWAEFPEDSDISQAFFGWDGRKQVVMRYPVALDASPSATLYAYIDLEKYYVPAAMEFFGGRSFAYMIDGKSGDYLAYTKNTVAQRTYTSLYEMLDKSGNTPKSLQTVRDLVENGQAGSIVLKTENSRDYLYFTPVENTPGWYMTAIVPLGVIQQARNSILILVVFVCCFIVLCVISLMLMLNSRRRTMMISKEREYRDMLFGLISENVEQVFMIYNGRRRQMEMVFDNALQVLGVDAERCRDNPMLFFERCESEPLKRAAAQMLRGTLTENVGEPCRYQHGTEQRLLWLKVKILRVDKRSDDNQYIVAVEDQTAEREARKNLDDALMAAEKASQAKSEFLSAMSHDIRTPMNAIMGMTELALLQPDCSERVRELLLKISSSGGHLLSLINDILDMSRIESGKLSINPQPMWVTQEIQRISDIIRGQAEERGQTFTVQINRLEHDALYGDALRINQVLINILANSVKFTQEGGTIRWQITELAEEPGWVRLRHEIQDNGAGMSPQFLPHLFDAFEQERRAGHTQGGSGLGMAITKKLVDLMGGTISVDSALGQGSTFVVELRLRINPEAAGARERAPGALPAQGRSSAEGWTLLLVDDNSLNREIAVEMLSVFGIRVETAENGARAVALFSGQEPNHYQAILMDIQMPILNGYDAARAIRALPRKDAQEIPIIAMTADAFAEDIQKAIDAGMDAHVSKPVDFRQLCALLQKMIDER
ncbi:MAG: ATP-binding protein [Christensenellales bacterium]